MSEETRIPCPDCGVMILPVTAKHNQGHCPKCSSKIEDIEQEKIKQYYLQNPPKSRAEVAAITADFGYDKIWLTIFLEDLVSPKINPKEFTEQKLRSELRKSIASNDGDPAAVVMDFHSLTDDVMAYKNHSLQALMLIPSPFRELRAVYQLWGILSSDGIQNYFDDYGPDFDEIVVRGMKLIGLDSAIQTLANARAKMEAAEKPEVQGGTLRQIIRAIKKSKSPSENPDYSEEEDKLFDDFDNFVNRLLGPYLIHACR